MSSLKDRLFREINIPEIPLLDISNDPFTYVRSINFPLSAEAEFTLEAEIDGDVYKRMIGFDAAPFPYNTGFSFIYSAPYQEQVRKHRKKRINKKWAKRYGYVTKFKHYQLDNVYVTNDRDGEYEFTTTNIHRIVR